MKKFLRRIYFLFILPPILIIGAILLFYFEQNSVNDPLDGLGNVIVSSLLFFTLFSYVLFSPSIFLLNRETVRNDIIKEIFYWFSIPFVIDLFLIYHILIVNNDFGLIGYSPNLLCLLAVLNASTLLITFFVYQHRKRKSGF